MKIKNNFKTFVYISILVYIGLNYYSEYTKIYIDTITPWTIVSREATRFIPYKEIKVITTAYSELDSCHTGSSCLMANGERAHLGAIATNFLSFGTRVEIDGIIYTVKDRHSKWLDDRIDIFTGWGIIGYNKAINYGKQIKTVKVFDN